MTIKIMQDNDIESPRHDRDGLADVMFCKHGRYVLGDDSAQEPDGTEAIKLPLYLYDHSGITISHTPFSCPWDSGQVGWHYMTQAKLDEEFSGDREKAEAYMKAVLEEYDAYLRGECWGFDTEEDSCWGFIGDTLDATGMKYYFQDSEFQELEAAWENRYES